MNAYYQGILKAMVDHHEIVPESKNTSSVSLNMVENNAVSVQPCEKRIGILIVSYNAVTTIAKVLKRIPADVWSKVEEIVIFDDASHDHTYELAVGIKTLAELDKLTVIKNSSNLGYGGNQKLGYKYFIDKGFDIVVLLHGDGQYAPEILSDLYTPLVMGEADAVFGSRIMKNYGGAIKGGMPVYKYIGNKVLTFLENKALNMDLTEFHSGYRAYSLQALRHINFDYMTDVFHFDTQIIIKLHHQGFRIMEIPIPTYYGDEICYVDGMKYAKDVFYSVIRYKRTINSLICYPEYKEYFIRLPANEKKYSELHYFMLWIGKQQDVLDIGCGEGFFAERLVGEGNRVDGIDMLEEPKHRKIMGKYLRTDIDQGLEHALTTFASCRYDRIMLRDVLEHVRNSFKLLTDCHQLLNPHGLLLVSIPNVANITVRLSLLFGRFEYTDRGILDKTHLKFFTCKSARQMLEHAGYEIVTEAVTIMPIESLLGITVTNPLIVAMNAVIGFFTKLMPGLLGYQILFSVRSRLSDASVEVSVHSPLGARTSRPLK